MTSVERILQYSTIEPEAGATSSNKPDPDWPAHGCIEFRDVELKYYESQSMPVLRQLSFHIKGQQKAKRICTL